MTIDTAIVTFVANVLIAFSAFEVWRRMIFSIMPTFRDPHALRLMRGITSVALSTWTIQAFWSIPWFFRALGLWDVGNSLGEVYGVWTATMVIPLVYGYALHVRPQIEELFGARRWWLGPVLFSGAVIALAMGALALGRHYLLEEVL